MKKRNRINSSHIILVVLVLTSSVMLMLKGDVQTAKEAGLGLFSFFQKGLEGSVNFVKSTVNSISELKELKKEYDEALSRLQAYEGLERNFLDVKRENRELKKQLDFAADLKFNNVPAEVISRDPGNLFSSFVISKGKSAGIKRNMPVIAVQNGVFGVVGKVKDVSSHSATVIPMLDISSYIAARLFDSRYEGLIHGGSSSDGLVSLKYIKKMAWDGLNKGDLVVTSGMNSIYPQGLYIGRIHSYNKVESETSLRIRVNPIIDFSRLEYVFVLAKEESNNE